MYACLSLEREMQDKCQVSIRKRDSLRKESQDDLSTNFSNPGLKRKCQPAKEIDQPKLRLRERGDMFMTLFLQELSGKRENIVIETDNYRSLRKEDSVSYRAAVSKQHEKDLKQKRKVKTRWETSCSCDASPRVKRSVMTMDRFNSLASMSPTLPMRNTKNQAPRLPKRSAFDEPRTRDSPPILSPSTLRTLRKPSSSILTEALQISLMDDDVFESNETSRRN